MRWWTLDIDIYGDTYIYTYITYMYVFVYTYVYIILSNIRSAHITLSRYLYWLFVLKTQTINKGSGIKVYKLRNATEKECELW